MQILYLIMGARLNVLFRLLTRNKITFSPKTLIRLFLLVQSAAWSSLFAVIEKGRFRKKIFDTELPEDPVFIIGHWRTGSTYLHQLMHLDKRFASPELIQISIPDSFLVSFKYYAPLIRSVARGTRPMDQVRIGINEPQEDEFALFRMTAFSPFERVLFPNGNGYFLEDFGSFLPSDKKDIEFWIRNLKQFYIKNYLFFGKRILSKNPFHSTRIELLDELYPNAKFIHIHRDPFEVVPSTLHLWNVAAKHNALNNRWKSPEIRDVARFYKTMLIKIEEDLSRLPESQYCDISYSNLVSDPVSTLKAAYEKIGLVFTDDLEQKILDFISENRGFRKNSYILSEEDREVIRAEMQDVVG